MCLRPGQRSYGNKEPAVSGSPRTSPSCPQGSILSPTLFNEGMVRVISSIFYDPLLGTSTFYADDVCVWSTVASRYHGQAPDFARPVEREARRAGPLHCSREISLYPVFGTGSSSKACSTGYQSHPTHRTKGHRFLGVVIDKRYSGVANVAENTHLTTFLLPYAWNHHNT